jgi:lipoprotein-releasing system ATP-binding protein
MDNRKRPQPSSSIRNPQSAVRNLLVVRDLRKAYLSPAGSKIEVLRDVSFSASAGEVLAITGASGAGKSTLLHLIGGLETADGGSIVLDGFDIARALDMASFRNEQVGFVFQFHHLIADLTAAENVALPLLIGRGAWRESMARVSEALERAGLKERAAHPVRHLSGGEQQRVAVARAIIKEPRLLLADEPTGNLDLGLAAEVCQMLISFCREREAVGVLATHNEQLAALCDRTLILRHGSLESA